MEIPKPILALVLKYADKRIAELADGITSIITEEQNFHTDRFILGLVEKNGKSYLTGFTISDSGEIKQQPITAMSAENKGHESKQFLIDIIKKAQDHV